MRQLTDPGQPPMSPLGVQTEADMRLYFGVDERGTPSTWDKLAARSAYLPILRGNELWRPPTRDDDGDLDFRRAAPLVYVPTPQASRRAVDPVVDASEEQAAQRRARIGLQLELADRRWELRERAGPQPGDVLDRFFSAPSTHSSRAWGRCGVLVDDTAEASAAHSKSRSKSELGAWLWRQRERLMQLRSAQMPSRPAERRALLTHRDALERLAEVLHAAAEALLVEAGRCYEDAAREMPRRPRARRPS